jgi:hypothetical protein
MNDAYLGTQEPASGAGEFNAMSYLVTQILNRASTSTLVQVVAVTNSGGLSPVGFVDVHPMVAQLDGNGGAVPHGVVHSLPYFRLQGGTNAVILDPQVGDIGIAIFADHDISAVKQSSKPALPGSRRRFDMADGMYMGGFLNAVPVQYVQFAAAGITVSSPTAITLDAPITTVTGDLLVKGKGTITKLFTYLAGLAGIGGTAGSIITGTVTVDGTNVHTHTHSGVQAGGSNTGAPN